MRQLEVASRVAEGLSQQNRKPSTKVHQQRKEDKEEHFEWSSTSTRRLSTEKYFLKPQKHKKNEKHWGKVSMHVARKRQTGVTFNGSSQSPSTTPPYDTPRARRTPSPGHVECRVKSSLLIYSLTIYSISYKFIM